MIKLIIPGQPMGKQRPKFGNGRTYTPSKTVNAEAFIKELYIIGSYGKQLEGALEISVRAYFQIPKSASKKKAQAMLEGKIMPTTKPDWDNIGKIVSDALNGLAYHDDSYIANAHVYKRYSDNPRVEIRLREIGA